MFFMVHSFTRINFKTLSGLTVREIYKRMDEVDPATLGQVTLQWGSPGRPLAGAWAWQLPQGFWTYPTYPKHLRKISERYRKIYF